MLIGYARTSTTEQKAGLADQVAELNKLGCDEIFEEYGSGIDAERPKLRDAIGFVRAGDVLVVTKPDRIARSAADLLVMVRTIQAKGCEVRILSLGIDTSTSTGKLMLTVLAGMAEFERDLMLERQRAGIAAAKAAGKYKGRKPTAMAKGDDVLKLKAEGLGPSEIAERLGIGRASVYRIFKDAATASAACLHTSR
jgi:DNA invertase Pin-like site-specific DNA recombinase